MSLIALFSQFIRIPTAHCFNEDPKMVSSAKPVYNNITSPFDKPWDFSQKADQERWQVASNAASNHICFDISVMTAEMLLELLKDKSKYCCWGSLMSVPINGTSAYDDKSDKLANSDEAMKVAFGTRAHLLTQWTKVTTVKCQQFAQWFNSNDLVKFDAPFQTDVTQRKVVALDCNTKNNYGLVRQ